MQITQEEEYRRSKEAEFNRIKRYYPIFESSQCVKCGMYVKWEPMWKSPLYINLFYSEYKIVCRKCCPYKMAAADCFIASGWMRLGSNYYLQQRGNKILVTEK